MGQPSRRVLNASPATLENARLRNLPPQNLDAEQAVLGGVLLKMSLLDKLGVELRPMDFYSPARRKIWEALLDLWRASKPEDLITLAAALATAGRLDAVLKDRLDAYGESPEEFLDPYTARQERALAASSKRSSRHFLFFCRLTSRAALAENPASAPGTGRVAVESLAGASVKGGPLRMPRRQTQVGRWGTCGTAKGQGRGWGLCQGKSGRPSTRCCRVWLRPRTTGCWRTRFPP
ncbi:DnaB-like helicase N-terminal domain-containing protein [Solidesulfovibrio alcoholivorans]|uniref:DnaB-like helicase N-terminal domain-containing protein n=1 Tax=Solidesulfovibrio alcoholivorans TaxID=81406 RepID=UPI0024804F00|nr:DnaB-like helicase N-terminal domain-containing protein [Solidesulfovibrio alcoholivorans]